MIDFSPFWNLLEQRNENWYTLNRVHGLSSATLSRLKHNQHVSTKTLNDLCAILDCDIGDLVRYVSSKDELIYDLKNNIAKS